MAFKVAIAGGKGGTGKSTIAVNLAEALSRGRRVLLVDSDVDNPSVERLLRVKVVKVEEVRIFKPLILKERCIKCGECVKLCPEHALIMPPDEAPSLIEDRCNGCKVCAYSCRYNAIEEGYRVIGFIKECRGEGMDILVGELKPGIPYSPILVGRLITKSLDLGASGYEVVIYDCPPGAGNAVIQLLKVVDLVILVTEPTPFGLHNFKVMMEALQEVGARPLLVVNKADVPGGTLGELKSLAASLGVEVLAEIPYDELAVGAYLKGVPTITINSSSPLAKGVLTIASKLDGFLPPRC